MDAPKPPDQPIVATMSSVQDHSAVSTSDTPPEAHTHSGELTPADILLNPAQASAEGSDTKANVVAQAWKPKSIASLLLSLPQELRLNILTRAVGSETCIELPHDDFPALKCKACKEEWDEYKVEVLSFCKIFQGQHDQLYDEALNIFLQANTFSIKCASGSLFLRNWLSEFTLNEDGEEPTTGMSWIRRVEVEGLATSAWPVYHRFLVSCPQLSHLTIVLKDTTVGGRFKWMAWNCGLDYPAFDKIETRLTTIVLDVTQKQNYYGGFIDTWASGRRQAKTTLEHFIPEGRVWFGKRKKGNPKVVVVVRILAKSKQKVDFQILPRVQLTNDMCDKFDLPHSVATEFNQK
ncbi:hypothetical protein BLS_008969 [Venturia inaequalis]|uniref:Uncharacterized protein n=1 Tax=Venturia inaequalis TaxID=5025 RepID=A0A8H3U9H9_VENIN|nr:hypothetical protein BLS_008969 [Venturia inaequalis]KAE9965313.1 hypothetical protein EG328_009816 [Venturia inaequalis]KAE9974603.1 hypothetical protein EG327_008726 [Venturia inaequalis]